LTVGLGVLALFAAEPGTGRAQSLNGSGSSFVGPMMSRWVRDYEKAKEIKVHYTPVGSGGGIRQFLEKEIDFACTDAPLTEEQLQKAKATAGAVLHIPLVLGGVVPAYNLEEIKEPLRFTGPVLADIFPGNIKKWNDPAIKELNAGVDLPSRDILVMHRSDASGSTAIFSDFLAQVSKDWSEKVGCGTSLRWPVGEGHKGNEEVAAAIQKTPGAIGYVELVYALRKQLQHGRVKNREGNFVHGSLEGVTAAAERTQVPADLRFSLAHAPGKAAYPLSGCTWAILYVNQSSDRGKRLVDFLSWVTQEGQESVTDLYYARLPKRLVEKVNEKLKEVSAGQ
jgi:phosphate transport system substrate-binding protein